MEMSEHPPLCPKTPDKFLSYDKIVRYVEPCPIDQALCMTSGLRPDRRFIARYQACAWLDRAARWLQLGDRYFDSFDKRWAARNAAYNECRINAALWCEWEKLL
jgi:hypothetical protein